jgi:hypothetical protein
MDAGESCRIMSESKGGTHPNSLANLRPPWHLGECPNPAGRPRKIPLAKAYRTLLKSLQRGERAGRLYARRLASVLDAGNTEP